MGKLDKIQASAVLHHIYETFDRHLWLPNWWLIDVVSAAIVGSYLTNTRPIWLAIVGPAGSGKSTVINSLLGIPGVRELDQITNKTFISGVQGSKKGKGPPKAVSILEKMADERDFENGIFVSDGTKFLVANDFGNIFNIRADVRSVILQQMRMIYDGKFKGDWGTGKDFHFQGRIGMIAGATPVWDRYMGPNSEMGDRFLVWRLTKDQKDHASTMSIHQDEEIMAPKLREAMAHLFEVPIPDRINVPGIESWLNPLSRKTCILRSPIIRDFRTSKVIEPVEHEALARFSKQLSQLARGLIILKDVDSWNDEEITYPVERVAISSIPVKRSWILSYLGTKKGIGIEEIRQKLPNYSTETVRRTLEELILMGAVIREHEGSFLANPEWEDYLKKLCRVMRRIEKEGGFALEKEESDD